MRGINKVILIGTLGVDPDMKYAANTTAMATLSVATSEQWNDKATGQKQEKTEWHRVVIFGKLAEVAGRYLKKGSQVYLEGKLQTRKWQDQSGQDRYTTEVVLSGYESVMEMLGGPKQDTQEATTLEPNDNQTNMGSTPVKPTNSVPVNTATVQQNYTNDWDDMDVPF